MKAKLSADDHKKLPAHFQSEYAAQADGSFLLAVETIDGFALENVVDLKGALAKERKGREDAAKLAEAFKDIDPAKAREALTKIEEMKTWKPEDKVREQIAAIKGELEGKLANETKTRDDRIGHLTKEIERVLVENAARAALAQHGVVETAEVLMPHIMKSLRAIEENGKFATRVVDEQGNARITGQTGKMSPMGADEYVASLREQKAFKPFFPSQSKTGSGASPSGGGGGKTLDFSSMTAAQMVDMGRQKASA